MPIPERYASQVPNIVEIWSPAGYFKTQTQIWAAQCDARNRLYDRPTEEQLVHINQALKLTPEDIEQLNEAKGHETNKLLRKIQGKLTPEEGNFIHLGNTSSDVLDTSLALQIIQSLDICRADFNGLSQDLLLLAIGHRDTLQIARTHGQHAIPQTFGRQVLGWFTDVNYGLDLFDQAKKAISVGKCSGEVGTNVFIDPQLEAQALFELNLKPDPAPTQVISRTRHAHVASLMGINGGILERIATNIRLLAMTDVGEVREPFDEKDQQGSSAMPHKRNPELSERICGLARILRGSVLAQMETVPLWFERDISHSSTERTTFPDIFGNLAYMTRLARKITQGLVVNSDRMAENLGKTYGAIFSSRLLNELLAKGLDRTGAYELVKGLSQQAIDSRTNLYELAARDDRIKTMLISGELVAIFDPKYYLQNIDVAYRRLGIT
ncbi:adenylosuccinate lyase [Candidatus Daviesbacteria bacterium]|nr:adenylosuccinate lyase [Candidatus Daviesbacteria bacterium]